MLIQSLQMYDSIALIMYSFFIKFSSMKTYVKFNNRKKQEFCNDIVNVKNK